MISVQVIEPLSHNNVSEVENTFLKYKNKITKLCIAFFETSVAK